jgi:hypothetical protein
MPVALYAITFKRTGSVLAVCSFEQRSLADPSASKQLLQGLVGDRVTIPVTSGQPIQIGRDDLAVDEITGPAQPLDVLSNVHGHQLDLPAGAEPGDGTPKDLVAANVKTVVSFALVHTGTLTVMLSAPEGPVPAKAWLIFEGSSDPIPTMTMAGQPAFTFTISSVNLVQNSSYGFVFVKDGVPVTAGYVNAS